MDFNDSFAYVPLFAIAIVSAVIFVLLFNIKKKSTARVSFVAFVADGIVFVASLIAAIMILVNTENDAIFAFYSLILLAALFLFLPYCIMLCTFEPKKIEKLVPKSYNEAAKKSEEAVSEKSEKQSELSEDDKHLLNISRDYMTHAATAYTTDKGMTSFLEYINNSLKEEIKADGAAILLVDDFEDVIAVKAFEGDFPPPYKLPNDMPHKPVRVATNFKFATFPFKDNIFGEIATAGLPELITKPELDSRIYQNGPEEFLECGSYIFVPMKTLDSVIGITAFARKNGASPFTEDDLKVACTLSDFASSAIQNVLSVKDVVEHSEITKESEIASRIQNMLKPAKLPVIQNVQIGTIWNQAQGVCGDYYDVIVSRKDRVSFIMSDIAGKGMNSIVIMAMIRAMLRLVINTTQSAGKILSWVNRGIAAESFSADHFGSVALINYDPTKNSLDFATGGITPVQYFDNTTGTFSKISKPSEPIGVEKTIEYKDLVQNIKSGDIIVTYTDGLVEALNEQGQQYSEDKLLALIAKNRNKSAKDIANLVKKDVKNFTGNETQHDDETLLIVKFQ